MPKGMNSLPHSVFAHATIYTPLNVTQASHKGQTAVANAASTITRELQQELANLVEAGRGQDRNSSNPIIAKLAKDASNAAGELAVLAMPVIYQEAAALREYRLERDDLLAEGRAGAYSAALAYDAAKGPFFGWARLYIRDAMVEHARANSYAVTTTENAFKNRLGREREAAAARGWRDTPSLQDTVITDWGESTLSETTPDAGWRDEVVNRDRALDLHAAIAKVADDDERSVLELSLSLELDGVAMAALFGMSRGGLSKLRSRALASVAEILKEI